MLEVKMVIRCQACGARNRVRIPAGKKVRVRCGNCSAPITLSRRGIFLLAFKQVARNFVADTLPEFLLAVAGAVAAVLRALFTPLRRVWRAFPARARRVLGWSLFAVLLVFYMVAEGTVKLASMLMLLAILVLATLAVILAVRGPAALGQIISQWTGSILRRCPGCGHRYFRWVRSCPRCGR